MLEQLNAGITALCERIIGKQQQDGTWRYGFRESGMMTDSLYIVTMRLLQSEGHEDRIEGIASRIHGRQDPDGLWRVYPDEKNGNLSATAESFVALLLAGYDQHSPSMRKALQAILRLGGVSGVSSLMTKFLLALAGYKSWPAFFPVPLVLLLLPKSSPLHFFHFSGYARVHMAPMLILGERRPKFFTERPPLLRELSVPASFPGELHGEAWSSFMDRGPGSQLYEMAKSWLHAPFQLKRLALSEAERFMLARLEADGTLYSYASSTLLMLPALRSLGYDKNNPVIRHAIEGLSSFMVPDGEGIHLQTTTSTVWDTALISHALSEAGIPPSHPSIAKAGQYLLRRQHTKLGDWKQEVADPIPGGWGFSDINTINPDVDDTTAALRALEPLRATELQAGDAIDRGLNWVLSMQNDDGGWGAFERNNNHPLIKWIPLDGADAAATDPSSADLTGRALEYLGATCGFTIKQPFIQRAVDWLYENQKQDGSWYGRWGVCFIYGTWAALTGLAAVGETIRHPRIRSAADWLLSIQNRDGGFGESCQSDTIMRYVPLRTSTLVQTAWALDALVSVHERETVPIRRAADCLLRQLATGGGNPDYPTGAALPGQVYSRYESYPLIWPLVALSHYRSKFKENFS